MSAPNTFPTQIFKPILAIIAVGQSESTPVQTGGVTPVGVMLPDSVTAANFGYSVSMDGITYAPLVDFQTGLPITTAVVSSRAFTLPPALFFRWNYFKFVGNLAQATLPITIQVMPGAL